MKRRIIVLAAIEHDGKYLLTLQSKKARHGGLWGFPGGNLEYDETKLANTLKREIIEEVGLEIEIQGLIGIHIEIEDDLQLVFFYFKAKKIDGKEKTSAEISDFRWLTLKELKEFPKDLIRATY